jgi:hypothetical protein
MNSHKCFLYATHVLPTAYWLLPTEMLWIVCSILVLLAAGFVLRPLFYEPKCRVNIELTTESEWDHLLNRKAAIYGNLKNLEFEFKMGRLSDSDFQQLRATYKNEAAEILQSLDQLKTYKTLDAEMENEIAVRKSKLFGSEIKHEKAPACCPACGAKTIPGKKFCADCGARL